MQGFLVENSRIVNSGPPLNITGAGLTGLWVSFKNHTRMSVVFQAGAWAGGTSAVTLNQAKDNVGGSSKAVSFNYAYSSTISGQTLDVMARVAVVSNTFNISAANQLWIVELNSYDIDAQGGFQYVQAVAASPGANADLLSIFTVSYAGWANAPVATQPTVLA
jgi:hypothetical protein